MEKNEHICDSLMQEVTDLVQELDFLCRASKEDKKTGAFVIDKTKKNKICRLIVEKLKEVKDIS